MDKKQEDSLWSMPKREVAAMIEVAERLAAPAEDNEATRGAKDMLPVLKRIMAEKDWAADDIWWLIGKTGNGLTLWDRDADRKALRARAAETWTNGDYPFEFIEGRESELRRVFHFSDEDIWHAKVQLGDDPEKLAE